MVDVIRVNNLRKAFKGIVAVDDVSFKVKAGQCFGLLGPNGAGKTTTIEMLEGILPKDSGQIRYFEGEDIQSAMDRIGIQFQHTAIQDFLTTKETLSLFRSFYSTPLALDTLLDLCDLHDFADQDHRKLSGGQKQRLLLALAMVNNPQILFLDEPTTGLDPHARRNFWQLVERIKSEGKTIVLTTHYMDEAESLCDEIVIMDKGKIIEQGAPEKLLQTYFPGVVIKLAEQALPESISAQTEVNRLADHIELTSQDVESTLKLLVREKVQLEGMQIKSANLDDLFLRLTGYSLEASNA